MKTQKINYVTGWTVELEQFVIENASKNKAVKLAAMIKDTFGINKSPSSVRAILKKIRQGTLDIRRLRFWTPEQIKFLLDNPPGKSHVELAAMLKERFGIEKSLQSINKMLIKHRFDPSKPRATRLFTLEQSQFLFDNVKGKKLTELQIMLKERFGIERTITQINSFKTLHKLTSFDGQNTLFENGIPVVAPIGSEIIKNGGIYVKVSLPSKSNGPSRYRKKSVVVWEAHFGKVPPKMSIGFKDGNVENCSIENLELIPATLTTAKINNGYYRAPDEIKPSLLLLSKVEVKIRELTKS